MIYSHAGMKVSILMHSYIGLAPLVLAIPAAKQNAFQLIEAYNHILEAEGANFPYTRSFGRDQELNHSLYPDLYYFALKRYSDAGALGTTVTL